MYTAGYVAKKLKRQRSPHLPDPYDRVDPSTGEISQVVPEFARMSRNPALGLRWLKRYYREVYPADFVLLNGFPMKPPRYYDRKVEEWDPELMELVRGQRARDVEHIGDEKLIMKEKVHRARKRIQNKRDTI